MKINGTTTNAKEFAYDGCHKIYLIESMNDLGEARDSGYDIHPISNLKNVFNDSCGLQFIYSWDLSNHYVKQFEDVCFET